MLYAHTIIQHGAMMILDTLNADLKIPMLAQFNAKLTWNDKKGYMINSYQQFK